MDVTVVIPVYQRQSLGERALRSVLGQTRPCREVILVDDASPDPFVLPPALVGDPRIKLVRHTSNKGAAAARNAGVALAQGPWIAFLDSDDFWLSDKLQRQLDFVAADQSAREDRLVSYATGFVLKRGGVGGGRALVPVESASLEDFASACWFCPGSTLVFHKEAASTVGPFDEALARLEDQDWFLRLGLAGGQLKVSPAVGSVIEVGPRPTPETVDLACGQLAQKWLAGVALPFGAAGKLKAYLALERASALRHAGNYPRAAMRLLQSFAYAPRASLHLRNWWTAAEPRANYDSP